MLVAYNPLLLEILARHADRGVRYTCPECAAEVVLKRGDLVTAHFAHKPASACQLAHLPESEEHRRMKLWFFDQLQGLPCVRSCRVEGWVGNRRADVWLETVRGSTVAIECQVSALGTTDVSTKLIDYRMRGVKALYAIHASVLPGWTPLLGVPGLHRSTLRVPAWLAELQRAYFDRYLGVRFAYVFDDASLWLLTFDPVERGGRKLALRQRVSVVGRVERFEGLIELRDGLLIVQGTDALLPHKAA